MTPVVTRQARRRTGPGLDARLLVEEPLELRVSGESVAMTMRTPGDDANLALGFFFSEGIIESLDEVSGIAPCGRTDEASYGNVLELTPAPGALDVLRRVDRVRRGTLTTAACGVCGRQTIDDLLERLRPVADGACVDARVVAQAPAQLRAVQPLFSATGGAHAAAALDHSGALLASAEDIGRHNAVDKVIGALLRRGVHAAVLVVSGRASFEMVQKAARANIGVLCSVSAASSLAVDLATRCNVALASFTRNDDFTLFGATHRIS